MSAGAFVAPRSGGSFYSSLRLFATRFGLAAARCAKWILTNDDRSQQFAEKNMRTKDEVAAYVAQHNLQEKLEAALQKVVGEQPSDPVAAIAATLTGSAGPTASSSPLLPRPRNAVGKFLRV